MHAAATPQRAKEEERNNNSRCFLFLNINVKRTLHNKTKWAILLKPRLWHKVKNPQLRIKKQYKYAFLGMHF